MWIAIVESLCQRYVSTEFVDKSCKHWVFIMFQWWTAFRAGSLGGRIATIVVITLTLSFPHIRAHMWCLRMITLVMIRIMNFISHDVFVRRYWDFDNILPRLLYNPCWAGAHIRQYSCATEHTVRERFETITWNFLSFQKCNAVVNTSLETSFVFVHDVNLCECECADIVSKWKHFELEY